MKIRHFFETKNPKNQQTKTIFQFKFNLNHF